MTTTDQLDFLDRRMAHLRRRITESEAAEKNASYDRQELAALEAVTSEIQAHRQRLDWRAVASHRLTPRAS